MVMMTEREVAAYLRCSCKTVQRLRQAGRLAYLPGRPLLIDQDDFLEFIKGEMQSHRAMGPPTREEMLAAQEAAQQSSMAAARQRARETQSVLTQPVFHAPAFMD